MGKVRVAIIGVGNCASALVQGVHFYRNAKEEDFIPGLMHVNLGGYHVRDIEFVAAFDFDKRRLPLRPSAPIFQFRNAHPTSCGRLRGGFTRKRSHVRRKIWQKNVDEHCTPISRTVCPSASTVWLLTAIPNQLPLLYLILFTFSIPGMVSLVYFLRDPSDDRINSDKSGSLDVVLREDRT